MQDVAGGGQNGPLRMCGVREKGDLNIGFQARDVAARQQNEAGWLCKGEQTPQSSCRFSGTDYRDLFSDAILVRCMAPNTSEAWSNGLAYVPRRIRESSSLRVE